jgi:hypothetical protein
VVAFLHRHNLDAVPAGGGVGAAVRAKVDVRFRPIVVSKIDLILFLKDTFCSSFLANCCGMWNTQCIRKNAQNRPAPWPTPAEWAVGLATVPRLGQSTIGANQPPFRQFTFEGPSILGGLSRVVLLLSSGFLKKLLLNWQKLNF